MGAETPEQAVYERYARAVGGLWLTDGNPEMPDSVEALPLVLQRAWEAVAAQEPKRAPGADADRGRYYEALQSIVDAVAVGDAAAVDKLARNALGLTRIGRPEPFQPAPELADDVHVDWHMTPGEWRQLYTVLGEHTDTPYIGRLIEAGKVPAPFGEPKPAPDPVQLLLGPCEAQGHDGEHLQLRTHDHWLCAITLTNMLVAADVIADPAPELTKVRAELDTLRELLDEIGVMAANAPEDGDSFGLLEQIAMRIAAVDVPDTTPVDEWPDPENPVTGRTVGGAEPEQVDVLIADGSVVTISESTAMPELAAAMRESRGYREALQVIAGYAAGTATKQMIGTTARRALEGKS